MDASFWLDRWRDGKIGFHEGRPNVLLARHVAALGAARRVLVPLCGKSEDLAFLAAAGHEVVGVELAEAAARAFFAEHGLGASERSWSGGVALAAGSITILVGDFFAVDRADVGAVSAFYDRAALIALPPAMRPPYAAHVAELVPAGAPGLLVVVDYPQSAMVGPPFSLPDAEVRALYPGADLAILDEGPAQGGRLGEAGVTGVERCYRLVLGGRP